MPLVDPQLVRETFEQRQQVRAHYSVASVLDVDRYDIEGEETPLVLGVRELDQGGINAGRPELVQPAHGLHARRGDHRGLRRPDPRRRHRRPDRVGRGQRSPARTRSRSSTEGFEQRIYFGEKSPDYSVVGKADEDADSVELALPGAAEAEDDYHDRTTATAESPVGSTFNQFMYALKFGEPNFLLSGRVNDNSQVLYNREAHRAGREGRARG